MQVLTDQIAKQIRNEMACIGGLTAFTVVFTIEILFEVFEAASNREFIRLSRCERLPEKDVHEEG